jgi:hypothetical protein
MIKKYLFIMLLVTIGCSTPPPIRTGTDNGAVAISVNLLPPVALMGGKAPEVVYFLKISNPGKMTESKEIIPSTYNKSDRFYLFNAKPGMYVAVAAFYKVGAPPGGGSSSSTNVGSGTVTVSVQPGPSDYTTFFSEEIAKSTLVNLSAGKIEYMGNLTVDMSLKLETADALQQHVVNLIRPGALGISLGSSMLSGNYNYLGSLKKNENDANSKASFKETAAKKELAESQWLELLK